MSVSVLCACMCVVCEWCVYVMNICLCVSVCACNGMCMVLCLNEHYLLIFCSVLVLIVY